jgi:hypothetical protein
MTEQKEFDSIKERAKKKLERDMGPELLAALYDPKTVEIMLNADGKVWQERQGERARSSASCVSPRRKPSSKRLPAFTAKKSPRTIRCLKASSHLTARGLPASSPRWCRPDLRHS